MKKGLCLALSLLMLVLCIPALAESTDWNYDANYAILRGYEGAGGDVVVPAEIDDFSVDVIGVSVFSRNETITSLTLPFLQRRLVRKTVHDVIVHRGTQRVLIALKPLEGGHRTGVPNHPLGHLVEVVGGNAGGNLFSQSVEHLVKQCAGDAHFADFFGCLNRNHA